MTQFTFILAATVFASAMFVQSVFAQQIPEQSMLPCDEAEQDAIAQATPDEIKRINAFTPAQIVARKNPRYPTSAARESKEGWVKVSYVIDEEGKVKDPIIEDYTGDSAFKRAAMNAIEQWQFTPAMKNGEPTQQCHQAVRIDFMMGNSNKGGTRRFVSSYKKANEYLKNNDIENAEALLTELKNGKDRNRYENAWMSNLEISIAKKLGDMPRELTSIKRTLSNVDTHEKAKRTFDDKYIGYLHQRMFALEVNQGYFADALNTVKAINALENSEELLAGIQQTVDKVTAFIDSDANLFVQGELIKSKSFFHLLARNQFGFTEIEGKLDTVEIRCDRHREKFTVAEDFVWSIPESWGQCRVLVRGDNGTRFSLVEVNQA